MYKNTLFPGDSNHSLLFDQGETESVSARQTVLMASKSIKNGSTMLGVSLIIFIQLTSLNGVIGKQAFSLFSANTNLLH